MSSLSQSQSPTPPEMEIQPPPALVNDDPSTYPSALWDWGDLLDFAADERLLVSFDSSDHLTPFPPVPSPPPLPPHPQPQLIPTQPLAESESYPSPDESGSGSDRVRKRDPRLICSNFVEGLLPCSCPELDQKLEEAELPKKKRVRGGSGVARCQVPGCEVDISELKGYHRRHRVCLRCANATFVVLDGDNKRYCQQCGKFHVLPDFDEGKRSCRRKLERHNNRRKRKPVDKGGVATKQQQVPPSHNDNSVIDVEDGKDNTCSSDQRPEQEASLIFEDGHIPAQGSVPFTHSINADNFVSVTGSGEPQPDEGMNDTKFELSPSGGDNKSAYSTVCPTGRISFKLYDWNPAEFPRRLRHQIFQWLSTMPVELEGYIRPGCTILTVFIAMPEIMWAKLSKDPVAYLDEFILKPGKMLFGRGSMTVYLNNMIFRLIKGGTSLKRVDVKLESPKLQFVYPTCFEAGKPIELVVCGQNLLQPKCRFLVSFSGKYLPHNYSVVPTPAQDEKRSCNNKFYKINIVNSDPNLFGPAFVEVENESGLSNFIPLIIGDESICSEMKQIEQKFNATLVPEGQEVTACCSSTCCCSDFGERQSAFSGLLLDIAWSVKVPSAECTEKRINRCQIKRYNRVLNYLIQNNSSSILGNVLHNLEALVKKMEPDSLVHCTCDCDVKLLHENMNLASDANRKHQIHEESKVTPGNVLPSSGCCCKSSFQKDKPSTIVNFNQDPEAGLDCKERIQADCSPDIGGKETDPLLNKEVVMNVKDIGDWPRKSCIPLHSTLTYRSRQTVFLIATFAVCFAVCAVLYHPNKVTQLAVAIRTRLAHKL
ncbi:PREDICTED: squamosa promoter-binding-like protein 7 isoform X2 [Camelina sativa]|uniref:Squamosa promoter-binding-like protein 7 isoform X2 n=1 Tax=Camelina sativa TaxID=90675 RepID=A0ABM0XYQ2_CAMSA|nr:PREDICTED: squamosa promoter-binding-like protein 7 isoform X2 [Camelina sativa]